MFGIVLQERLNRYQKIGAFVVIVGIVVAVIGDPDFDQSRELPLILEAMKAHHPNVTYAFIDNNLPKKEKGDIFIIKVKYLPVSIGLFDKS